MEIYYKRLIREHGLWNSPKKTAKIIREAHSYNQGTNEYPDIKFFWKDVAKDLGISRGKLSKITNGKTFPNKELMNKLIEYFGLYE